MRRICLLAIASVFAAPVALKAQDNVIINAMSAGPLSITFDARIMEWDGNVIRDGSNGWTCLPDRADTPGNDPWCVDATWLGFIDALVNGREPDYNTIGIAYMLMGDSPVSNTDPTATSKTSDADWVVELGAHLMMLIPDASALEGVSTDPYNGGPWIMWPGTPYQHLMIPVDSYSKP